MESQKKISKTRSAQWLKGNKNSGEGMKRSLSREFRKWEDLQFDILVKIFSGVPLSDLSCNVTLVCKSWQLSCWHFLFRVNNVLDLSVIKDVLEQLSCQPFLFWANSVLDLSAIKDVLAEVEPAAKVMVVLKSLLEDNDGWRLSIRKVSIPQCLEISDENLHYIAERTIGIEELVLLGSLRITGRGFEKAILNWKNVRSIHLGKVEDKHFPRIMEEIGRNCYTLETVSLSDFLLTSIKVGYIIENLARVNEIRFHDVFIHFYNIERIFSCLFHKVQLCSCVLSCTPLLENGYYRRDWWNSFVVSIDFTIKTMELDKTILSGKACRGTNPSVWNDFWKMLKTEEGRRRNPTASDDWLKMVKIEEGPRMTIFKLPSNN